jgi:hypothetical protein
VLTLDSFRIDQNSLTYGFIVTEAKKKKIEFCRKLIPRDNAMKQHLTQH